MKLECFQHSGTFKARGALSVTKQITEEDKKFGITAASAGNHAIAAAWAAKVEKLSAKVVMQTSANHVSCVTCGNVWCRNNYERRWCGDFCRGR